MRMEGATVFLMLSSAKRVQGVNVGRLVDLSLKHLACDLTVKEACAICDLQKSQWSRGISGTGALDLWHLQFLPWRFWTVFFPLFTKELVRVWLRDVTTDYAAHLAIQKERAS